MLGFFGIVVLIAGWLYGHQAHLPAALKYLPWIIAARLVWKWAKTAKAFRIVRHSGLYEPEQWRRLVAIWLGLTAGVIVSALLACSARQIPAVIILFLAEWLSPGYELAQCAINLAENRHR